MKRVFIFFGCIMFLFSCETTKVEESQVEDTSTTDVQVIEDTQNTPEIETNADSIENSNDVQPTMAEDSAGEDLFEDIPVDDFEQQLNDSIVDESLPVFVDEPEIVLEDYEEVILDDSSSIVALQMLDDSDSLIDENEMLQNQLDEEFLVVDSLPATEDITTAEDFTSTDDVIVSNDVEVLEGITVDEILSDEAITTSEGILENVPIFLDNAEFAIEDSLPTVEEDIETVIQNEQLLTHNEETEEDSSIDSFNIQDDFIPLTEATEVGASEEENLPTLSSEIINAEDSPLNTEIVNNSDLQDGNDESLSNNDNSSILTLTDSTIIEPAVDITIADVAIEEQGLDEADLDTIPLIPLVESMSVYEDESTDSNTVDESIVDGASSQDIEDSGDQGIDSVIVPLPLQNTDENQLELVQESENMQESLVTQDDMPIVIIQDSSDIQESISSDMLDSDVLPLVTDADSITGVDANPNIMEPSQTLEVYVGDYLDVYLLGQGWIYLGAVSQLDDSVLDFYARYIDGSDTLFNFYAANSGTVLLHFYKQDIIANLYLDEYIEVVVHPVEQSREKSSSYVEELFGISAEPEVSLVGGQGENIIRTDTNSSSSNEFVPEDILTEAQIAYDDARYADSIALLDEYTSLGVSQIDRALFLYGKNYEANSELKNIRQALASYKKIIESFPHSEYWAEASKRIIYLERFYVDIR